MIVFSTGQSWRRRVPRFPRNWQRCPTLHIVPVRTGRPASLRTRPHRECAIPRPLTVPPSRSSSGSSVCVTVCALVCICARGLYFVLKVRVCASVYLGCPVHACARARPLSRCMRLYACLDATCRVHCALSDVLTICRIVMNIPLAIVDASHAGHTRAREQERTKERRRRRRRRRRRMHIA
jgi:hypothetical protein